MAEETAPLAVKESALIAVALTAARVEDPETLRAPPMDAPCEVAIDCDETSDRPERLPVSAASAPPLTRHGRPRSES